MRPEQAHANIELQGERGQLSLEVLVDSGASKSVISARLAEKLGRIIPLEKPYELRTADRGGSLRIFGRCIIGVRFEGVEVPGGAVFEVAENLRENMDIVIGRPEMDSWKLVFTDEGPRPKKVPIEFDII